jgi:hypothetical protein
VALLRMRDYAARRLADRIRAAVVGSYHHRRRAFRRAGCCSRKILHFPAGTLLQTAWELQN